MEPAKVTTRSKTRFLKGLRSLCRASGNKIHSFVHQRSKDDASALDSSSNRYANASEEHSIMSEQRLSTADQYPNIPECTSEQCSSTPETHVIALEQCSNKDISTPCSTDKPNLVDQSRPNIDTLPNLVLLHLFTYLNAQDLCNLGW